MTPSVSRLTQLERALLSAEKKLSLLGSVMPGNFSAEVLRLAAAFERGRVEMPHFCFSDAKERQERGAAVSALLAASQIALGDAGFRSELVPGLFELLMGRIEELLLDEQMLRECGQPSFRSLARARYHFSQGELALALRLSQDWSCAQLSSDPDGENILLAAAFEQKRRQMVQFGERVVIVERELASVCAVGGSSLYVRRGARVPWREAERLWIHEVQGHLLPRLAAEREPAPFSIGAPESDIDEEGRAVLLEEKHGLLGGARKRELSLRFHLALALREGGEEGVREQLRVALDAGAAPESLARSVCRIFRGGGLGRELIYLPAYLRVKMTLEGTPSLEQFFRRGRVSVRTLDFFQAYYPLGSSKSMTTGA